MDITSCTKADYDQIVTHIQEFWGGDRTLNFHHPMFVYEFGNSAYIIKDEPGCGLPLWLHLTDGA
jgi:hypothetical protein